MNRNIGRISAIAPKLAGQGVHLLVPIQSRLTHDQARTSVRRWCNGRGNTSVGDCSPERGRIFPFYADEAAVSSLLSTIGSVVTISLAILMAAQFA